MLRQREHVEHVRADDGHVLLAVLALERHGVRVTVPFERGDPKLLARLGIESAEAVVRSGTDENEPSARRDRACAAAVPGVLLAFRQTFGDAERGLPRDF